MNRKAPLQPAHSNGPHDGEGRTARVFSRRFFTVRQIAGAAGMDKKSVRNRARIEGWPMQRRGNRVEYRAPLAWTRDCWREVRPGVSLAAILNKPETLRALDRAAAVNGFARELQRDPKCGVERALARTASNFRHLKDFSGRVLRRWIGAVLERGLAGLHENKCGRVGRRATALHKILK